MIPYYCNEAMLELADVRGLVDLTRHFLQVVTEAGVEIELTIERVRLQPSQSLAAAVESSLAERKRSLRGFQLVSSTECAYPDVSGVEARLTFVDKERGPRFVHEFHCVLDATWMVYQGACRLSHATACDEWMQSTLQSLKLR
ncbi:MAG: hypothetical protein IPM79_12325 [Polyangiaceae bacterium]|jgi:hypothetical protein|nr:hypothetical protein [Polyangiaceae bacterium]MBK8938398.1 hypothetical protein [Polyangiaceae bacterium]